MGYLLIVVWWAILIATGYWFGAICSIVAWFTSILCGVNVWIFFFKEFEKNEKTR